MVINPIVGVYIPIIRIPIKGGRSPIPKKTRLLTMAHVENNLDGHCYRVEGQKLLLYLHGMFIYFASYNVGVVFFLGILILSQLLLLVA